MSRPVKTSGERIVGLSVYKGSIAMGYGWSSSTLLRKMKIIEMKITSAKKLSPKEVNFLIQEYGEPNWCIVRKFS